MQKKPKAIQSSKAILGKYDFLNRLKEKAKHISTEHQDYGMRLSGRLGDTNHKALYIKLAKDLPRGIMESAASFAIDYPDKSGTGNKGKIFMWKLKQLCQEKNVKIPSGRKKLSRKQQYLKTQIKLI